MVRAEEIRQAIDANRRRITRAVRDETDTVRLERAARLMDMLQGIEDALDDLRTE